MPKRVELERKGTAVTTRPIYGPKKKKKSSAMEVVGSVIGLCVVGAIVLAIL